MDGSDLTCPNNQLRQERVGHNWCQQDVADQVGTTVVTVNRWERGSQQPSAYFRVRLCALFGKSAEELGLVAMNALQSTPTDIEVSGEISTSSSPIDGIRTLWMVPYQRNPYFTGRDELLHSLDQHLSIAIEGEAANRRAALTQPQAIKGLGGIGKTQIAVEYAYRAREQGQYTHTFWIDAASKEAMMTSFTILAELLPEFPAKNETNQQKLVKAVKRWLEQCQERWFLIFDNADDLSLIQEYFPHQGNGSILLTTRANAVGSLAASIEVESALGNRRWGRNTPIWPALSTIWLVYTLNWANMSEPSHCVSERCTSGNRRWDRNIPWYPMRLAIYLNSINNRGNISKQSRCVSDRCASGSRRWGRNISRWHPRSTI